MGSSVSVNTCVCVCVKDTEINAIGLVGTDKAVVRGGERAVSKPTRFISGAGG